MRQNRRFLLTVAVLAFVVMSCDLPLSQTSQPTVTPLSPILVPIAPTDVAPTFLPVSTSTAIPTKPIVTATVTKTPVADLSGATLKISDFPTGFQVLDAQTQSQIGFYPENYTSTYQQTFRQAQVVSTSAFINPSSQQLELVFSMVFFPLSATEQTKFDDDIKDPSGIMAQLSKDLNTKVTAIPNADKIGNMSTGITFTSTSGALVLRGELVHIRRENAAIIIFVSYRDGFKPPVTGVTIGPILDARVKTALGK